MALKMGSPQLLYSLGHSDFAKLAFCIVGVMSTLVLYGLLQERIMSAPYGAEKEYFRYSLFIVLCNRVLTSIATATIVLVKGRDIAPVAPVYKYGAVSISNVLSTTCQYEALKHVSFPVQTLGKCAKMLPVMVWGTFIMQKRYNRHDYIVAASVTVGCAVFFLTSASAPLKRDSENNLWGILLMTGYLGFDGFTSTFQDKLFKGYNMDIFNQIFYVTLCSGVLSITGLLLQGQWLLAINFVIRHPKCMYDILLLSCAATTSQFFISYTIRTFGALIFATLMTTRQLISIFLSCLLFAHPLTVQQWGAAIVVFSALYFKSYINAHKKDDNRDRSWQNSREQDKTEQFPLMNRVVDIDGVRQEDIDGRKSET
ncbi:solute carrier family 35 (adenosine 3'-phospho 5'-phosphosulfate transporter), member B2 [Marchantia polymorpha subsp. ruderalis]|uniref:Uncharacterized protein n=2 Tax=Marchantia polymorpha TaxID=3197 RepID=A0A176VUL7_MARPO|nr:hypothetical protein AXG93_1615s1480 [Marchantia polymorpha subsp. ruderalis]PTQ40576.1 hypothetical protein MARPO_0039s0069 [Marchantia polymorpha]BBN05948.1 hypothetical protein Mp_3g17250 [Marchantia polymorpha subsp. ruderalis]|eukprot:PTQ40576.1 hypothetical protein MARPO_0039s0069 [Marchantia polymorpha]